MGTYTVTDVAFSSGSTFITVKEKIPANDNSGTIEFEKRYPIIGTKNQDTVIIAPGREEIAVQRLIDTFRAKFFNREGMHVIENTLLASKASSRSAVASRWKQSGCRHYWFWVFRYFASDCRY